MMTAEQAPVSTFDLLWVTGIRHPKQHQRLLISTATAEEIADVAAVKLRYPNASPFYLCDGKCGRVASKGHIHSFRCIVEDLEIGEKGGYIEVLRYEEAADARLNRMLTIWHSNLESLEWLGQRKLFFG